LLIDNSFFASKKLLEGAEAKDKTSQLLVKYEKLLEDEVAAGLSIEEIAKKINAKLVEIKGIDESRASADKLFADISMQLFEVHKDELSYPAVIENQKIILFKIDNISPSIVPEIKDIKEHVKMEFNRVKADGRAKEILEELREKSGAANLHKHINLPYIKLEKDVLFSKNTDNSKYPIKLIEMIFETAETNLTNVYIDENFGYMALVEQIKINEKSKKAIDKNLIAEKVTEGYYQELLQYLQKINDIKINYEDPIFKE
jgi:hypothetical protein